jgi:hypothetical protein
MKGANSTGDSFYNIPERLPNGITDVSAPSIEPKKKLHMSSQHQRKQKGPKKNPGQPTKHADRRQESRRLQESSWPNILAQKKNRNMSSEDPVVLNCGPLSFVFLPYR